MSVEKAKNAGCRDESGLAEKAWSTTSELAGASSATSMSLDFAIARWKNGVIAQKAIIRDSGVIWLLLKSTTRDIRGGDGP